MDTIDLNAYFERIGYRGPREPTLDVLREIHRLHPQAIPFENLNPVMRWPVALDLPSIERKLVSSGRGGYCFEHNLFLTQVLTQLGFGVKTLAARVVWNLPPGTFGPRSHMLMLVDVESAPYIVDVGFGGMTQTAPLRFEIGLEQETPHEPFRLLEDKGHYVLEGQVRGEWKPTYRFDLETAFLPDYEVASWYLSNHPSSHFIANLMAARTAPGVRYALRNNSLATHHINAHSELRTLTTTDELYAVLTDVFGIRIPRSPEVLQGLSRFTEPTK
jgi:N-hydroxyarylamine O-acetyltransferase